MTTGAGDVRLPLLRRGSGDLDRGAQAQLSELPYAGIPGRRDELLDWCKRGKECVGDAIYDKYMRNKAVGLKKHLLAKSEKGDR